MRLALASDHAGYPLKNALAEKLFADGHAVTDLGTRGHESVDYPGFAHLLCRQVLEGRCERGILVCNSGIGMSIAANRHRGIRAALCLDVTSARYSRMHNDANVLVLAGGFTAAFHAWEIVSAFLSGEFQGGRHARRIAGLDPEASGD